MNVTEHAAERYVERINPDLSMGEAKDAIVRAVSQPIRVLLSIGKRRGSRTRVHRDGITYVLVLNEKGPAVITCYQDHFVRIKDRNDKVSAKNRDAHRGAGGVRRSSRARIMRDSPRRASQWR